MTKLTPQQAMNRLRKNVRENLPAFCLELVNRADGAIGGTPMLTDNARMLIEAEVAQVYSRGIAIVESVVFYYAMKKVSQQ